MRRLFLFGLLAVMVLPAFAAKRVTVLQLQQVLAGDFAAHRADAEIARHLGEFELIERLSDTALGRMGKDLPLQPRTALALQLLADQSAFLEPPPAELPATEPPNPESQERMMDLARGYVVNLQPRLPNFFVTRTTARFDDSPQVLHQGDWPVRMGMHLVGVSTRNLTYRDGHEILDAATEDPSTHLAAASAKPLSPPAQPEQGMSSRGEFGPELSIVLTDTAKGKITFSHWEQAVTGVAAVFNYSVPKTVSHFEVSYCCLREDAPSQRRELRYGNQSRGAPAVVATAPADAKLFQATPGYHGTLSIDPATGAILRVTIEAELKGDDPISRAATVVQYGPVMIGDQRFIFPVRSLAYSMEQPVNQRPEDQPTLLINQTTFSRYHRLAASIRLFANAPDAAAVPTTPPSPNPPASESPADTATSTPQPTPAVGPATTPAPAAAASSTADLQPIAPAAPVAPAEPATPEMTVTAANSLPDQPSNDQPQPGDFQLKVTSRLVDVGIVVWDKKGHPVKDLKASDFEIYDNGHKQDVRFFNQYSSDPSAPPVATNDHSFSNHAPETSTSSTTDSGATVLLLDQAHIAWPDLSNAKDQILKFVATLAPAERVGVYSMTSTGFRVVEEITTDHADLAGKLKAWMPTAQSAALAQEEETRNRQSFNEVHNTSDLNSVNGNFADVPDAEQTVDPMLRTMGSNPARASLIILRMVARHLSAVTGHKNLVWVSSDNVFADFTSHQVGIDKSPKEVDSFAMHAQEAMNDAHVAVYPMDVSQLESAAINADIRTRNVELNQAAADTASQNGGSVASNLAPGRSLAEMQQDMRPIQGPIRIVAESTGGRVIRRSGELASALTGVVEDGHATYMLGFSPQGAADDQYHNISIKLTGGHKGLTLRYRTGYLYTKEPSSLKDRFQQAVWQPMDVSEIAVTANAAAQSPGAKLKLGIAGSDLGLEQRGAYWMDKLDIFFIQRDDAGIKAQVEGQTLGLRLKPSTYQSMLAAGVPFEHDVQMKKGMGTLRVLVVDENSGRMGSVTIPGSALEGKN
jgi:VWFA-related protein